MTLMKRLPAESYEKRKAQNDIMLLENAADWKVLFKDNSFFITEEDIIGHRSYFETKWKLNGEGYYNAIICRDASLSTGIWKEAFEAYAAETILTYRRFEENGRRESEKLAYARILTIMNRIYGFDNDSFSYHTIAPDKPLSTHDEEGILLRLRWAPVMYKYLRGAGGKRTPARFKSTSDTRFFGFLDKSRMTPAIENTIINMIGWKGSVPMFINNLKINSIGGILRSFVPDSAGGDGSSISGTMAEFARKIEDDLRIFGKTITSLWSSEKALSEKSYHDAWLFRSSFDDTLAILTGYKNFWMLKAPSNF